MHYTHPFFSLPRDIYVAMEKPNELEFGHVAENSNNWEQRYEKINLDDLQRQGKVRRIAKA